MKRRPVSRKRWVQTEITEYRCHACGEWFRAKRPAITCSPRCRVALHRMTAAK